MREFNKEERICMLAPGVVVPNIIMFGICAISSLVM